MAKGCFKISNEQVIKIRLDYQGGLTVPQLVKKYNISPASVSNIIHTKFRGIV